MMQSLLSQYFYAILILFGYYLEASDIGSFCLICCRCRHLVWANIGRIWPILAPIARWKLLRQLCQNRDTAKLAQLFSGRHEINGRKLAQFMSDNASRLTTAIVYGGHLSIIKWLYESSIFNYAIAENTLTQFCEIAIKAKKMDIVNWVLGQSSGQYINRKSLLFTAISSHNLEAIKLFSAENIDEGSIKLAVALGEPGRCPYTLDLINCLRDCGHKLPYKDIANYAMRYRDLDIIEWIYDNAADLVDMSIILMINVFSGQVESLKWLMTNFWDNDSPNSPKPKLVRLIRHSLREFFESGVNINYSVFEVSAARNGRLDLLKWLKKYFGGLENIEEIINTAASHGHVSIMEWIRQKYPYQFVAPYADRAAIEGQLAVLRWLDMVHGLEWINMRASIGKAIMNSHISALKWLCERYPEIRENQWQPNYESAIWIEIFYINVEMLKWLKKVGLNIPDIRSIVTSAIRYSDIEVLNWLWDNYYVYPASRANITRLGAKKYYRPIKAEEFANINLNKMRHILFNYAELSVFQWLHDKGLSNPNGEIIELADPAYVKDGANRLGLKLLQWMADNGYKIIIDSVTLREYKKELLIDIHNWENGPKKGHNVIQHAHWADWHDYINGLML